MRICARRHEWRELGDVFAFSWKILTQTENSYEVLSHKPIREELIDMSDCIRKRIKKSFYLREWREKHPASNLEQVTQCKYSLCFWCAHT